MELSAISALLDRLPAFQVGAALAAVARLAR